MTLTFTKNNNKNNKLNKQNDALNNSNKWKGIINEKTKPA